MAIVIRKKRFKKQDKPSPEPLSYILNLNTFFIKVLIRLLYNCEVNRPLIARFLLDLPDYYISTTLI